MWWLLVGLPQSVLLSCTHENPDRDYISPPPSQLRADGRLCSYQRNRSRSATFILCLLAYVKENCLPWTSGFFSPSSKLQPHRQDKVLGLMGQNALTIWSAHFSRLTWVRNNCVSPLSCCISVFPIQRSSSSHLYPDKSSTHLTTGTEIWT